MAEKPLTTGQKTKEITVREVCEVEKYNSRRVNREEAES